MAMDEKDPKALPRVKTLEIVSIETDRRLTDAEARVKRLEIRVEVIERGNKNDPVRS